LALLVLVLNEVFAGVLGPQHRRRATAVRKNQANHLRRCLRLFLLHPGSCCVF
jgi:hypothetical protein